MKLKNYTSETPCDRSLSRIEAVLVSIGASNINKRYEGGKLIAIMFSVTVNGNDVPFKLPAKVDVVEKVLRQDCKRPRKGTLEKIYQQAERTAWKIVCDWVEIQGTMIKLQQAEFLEVFMPYVYSLKNNQTMFERMKEGNYKALLS